MKPPLRAWTKAWRAWLDDSSQLSSAARWILTEQLARLAQLDEHLKHIHARLDEQVADDPMIPALEQHSGVGRVTAVTLRAEIGSWRRFRSGKQLARYCGVTPCNASSGKRVADAGLVKSGNRELRAVLIEAAHRLAQHDPKWRRFRDQLRERKPYNVIMAAIANRWIRWLYHQMIQFEGEPLAAAIT